MPQVLQILNRLNIGGPSFAVAYLAKHLPDSYKNHILAGYKEINEGSSEYLMKDLNLSYEYVPKMFRSINIFNDISAFYFIHKVITQKHPEIVHTHAAKAGALGRFAAYYNKRRPKVIIHTYHGHVFEGYFSWLKVKLILAIERFLAKKSDAIIVLSLNQKNELVKKYKIAPKEKIHVIEIGLDLSIFTQNNDTKRQQFRSFYNIQDDIIVITIIGRLTAIKNHHFFINTIKLLKENNPELKFRAFIVGDGELMDEIIQAIKIAGLSFCTHQSKDFNTDFILTSWRKDIDVVNAGSDIIALTSLNEGTPVSLIEAMASNKCVISTDVGGVKDVVEHGVTGFICDNNENDYAIYLAKLANNAELRGQFSNAGRTVALEKYSYERFIRMTENLYKFLLNNSNLH